MAVFGFNLFQRKRFLLQTFQRKTTGLFWEGQSLCATTLLRRTDFCINSRVFPVICHILFSNKPRSNTTQTLSGTLTMENAVFELNSVLESAKKGKLGAEFRGADVQTGFWERLNEEREATPCERLNEHFTVPK